MHALEMQAALSLIQSQRPGSIGRACAPESSNKVVAWQLASNVLPLELPPLLPAAGRAPPAAADSARSHEQPAPVRGPSQQRGWTLADGPPAAWHNASLLPQLTHLHQQQLQRVHQVLADTDMQLQLVHAKLLQVRRVRCVRRAPVPVLQFVASSNCHGA